MNNNKVTYNTSHQLSLTHIHKLTWKHKLRALVVNSELHSDYSRSGVLKMYIECFQGSLTTFRYQRIWRVELSFETWNLFGCNWNGPEKGRKKFQSLVMGDIRAMIARKAGLALRFPWDWTGRLTIGRAYLNESSEASRYFLALSVVNWQQLQKTYTGLLTSILRVLNLLKTYIINFVVSRFRWSVTELNIRSPLKRILNEHVCLGKNLGKTIFKLNKMSKS